MSITLHPNSLMETIEIPATSLLEFMMKKLQLPLPIYMTRAVDGGQIVIRVVFYPDKQHLQKSIQPQSFSSCPSNSTEVAKNDAVVQAINYMEVVQKKVIRQFGYTEMEKNKKANKALLQQLKEKDEKIGKKTNQLNEITKSYNDFIDTTCGFSDRICKIATANLGDRQYGTLLDIESIASDLLNLTFETTEMLKAKGTKHHSDSDFTQDEHFSGCSGSEAQLDTHSDCEIYN